MYDDKNKEAQTRAAFDMAKDILDERDEEFKKLFADILKIYKETDPKKILRFLSETQHINSKNLYKIINEKAHLANKIKSNRLAYLLKIILEVM